MDLNKTHVLSRYFLALGKLIGHVWKAIPHPAPLPVSANFSFSEFLCVSLSLKLYYPTLYKTQNEQFPVCHFLLMSMSFILLFWLKSELRGQVVSNLLLCSKQPWPPVEDKERSISASSLSVTVLKPNGTQTLAGKQRNKHSGSPSEKHAGSIPTAELFRLNLHYFTTQLYKLR